jgi:hypothetical protein
LRFLDWVDTLPTARLPGGGGEVVGESRDLQPGSRRGEVGENGLKNVFMKPGNQAGLQFLVVLALVEDADARRAVIDVREVVADRDIRGALSG